MGDVNSSLTLAGSGESGSGLLSVAAGHSPMDVVGDYWGQSLPASGSYDPGAKKLTLTVSGIRPSVQMSVKFTDISPSMAMQLRTIAGGGTVNIQFSQRGSSLVGMHIEPVVQ
jgi:hypothetical protein